jgi:hypothetical protein
MTDITAQLIVFRVIRDLSKELGVRVGSRELAGFVSAHKELIIARAEAEYLGSL